jgi:hypothetical protein
LAAGQHDVRSVDLLDASARQHRFLGQFLGDLGGNRRDAALREDCRSAREHGKDERELRQRRVELTLQEHAAEERPEEALDRACGEPAPLQVVDRRDVLCGTRAVRDTLQAGAEQGQPRKIADRQQRRQRRPETGERMSAWVSQPSKPPLTVHQRAGVEPTETQSL